MKNMMFIKTTDSNVSSFSLIPISENCPYIEAVFNTDEQKLTVFSKDKKQYFQESPATKAVFNKNYVLFDRYYEYSITDKNDIKRFVNIFSDVVVNIDSYFK